MGLRREIQFSATIAIRHERVTSVGARGETSNSIEGRGERKMGGDELLMDELQVQVERFRFFFVEGNVLLRGAPSIAFDQRVTYLDHR
jgi:hypothetical protein